MTVLYTIEKYIVTAEENDLLHASHIVSLLNIWTDMHPFII